MARPKAGRPNRGYYATGAKGDAQYRKDVQKYNEDLKKAKEAKTKLSTEKQIKKQTEANKKSANKSKTSASKTKQPRSSAAKGKSLASGKKTSKTKATDNLQKQPEVKKRGRPRKVVETPKNNNLKIAKDLAEKTYKGTKKRVGSAVKQTRKFAEKQAPKVEGWKKTLKAGLRKKNPPAETRPQKVFQAINQTMRKGRILGKKYLKDKKPFRKALTKGVEAIKADKGKSLVKGGANLTKGAIAYTLADAAMKRATAPVTNRIVKSYRNAKRRSVGMKNLTLEESNKISKDWRKKSGAEKKAILKKEKEFIKDYRAKNPKPTKNKDSSKKGLYAKYGQRLQNISDKAKNKTNKTDKPKNNTKSTSKDLKINKSSDYLDKPKVRSVDKTDYNINTEGGKKAYNNALLKSNAPKPGSARAKMREKNVKRFGQPHVDRLVKKNREFQEIKKIKDRNQRKKRREEYRQKYGR